MIPRFFDAHVHVQFPAFDADREAVVARAAAAGVGMVTVGTQRDTSAAAVEAARAYKNIWATVGLHPIHTSRSFYDAQELGGGEAAKAFTSRGEEFDYGHYRTLALDPRVVAIGECGLDYAAFVREERERLQKRASADLSAEDLSKEEVSNEGGRQETIEERKMKQKQAFTEQIALAHDVSKPLMIHCRDAMTDLIQLLTTNYSRLTDPPGLMHFFSGTIDEARQLLDLGFSFTFGGVITFVREYDEVVRFLPLDRVLAETDAPYVAPIPYRGKRNEPVYILEVIKKLAELKDVTVEVMAEQTLANTRRVFKSIDFVSQ